MPSTFLPSIPPVSSSPAPRYRRLGHSTSPSPLGRREMDKFFSFRQLPRSTIVLLAFSPVLLIGLAILHDNQLQKIIATTHATLLQDGALEATVARRTRMLHAVSEAKAAAAAAAAAPVAAAVDPSRQDEAASRGAIRKLKLGKTTGRKCAGSGGEAKSFVMVFMGHSGSSAVMSELNAHSRVKLTLEPEAVDHREKENNTTAALLYVRQFFRDAIAEGKIPGFKMRPKHIRNDPDGWRAFVREFDARIIWNYRSNLVKQAVGEYSYKKLGDTSVVEGLKSETAVKKRCEHGVGCKFPIEDMDFFHHTLKDLVNSDNLISSAAHLISAPRTPDESRMCVHELPYEDYLYDRRGTMEALSKFMGIKFEDNKPTRFKATKDNMCEVVENWDELCRNLYGCYAWRGMMDDEVNGCTCNTMGEIMKYCGTNM